jgi:hypothetical protein
MIDTDKYEGHTPAEHWDFSTWGITMPTGFEADAQLIADAPLLLAEVERLREAIDNIAKGMDEDWRHWRNELKKVIE